MNVKGDSLREINRRKRGHSEGEEDWTEVHHNIYYIYYVISA
jgi:hypothetical protein